MTGISESVATDMSGGAELSRSLKSRHVSMIAIGGIIGAGVDLGTGAAYDYPSSIMVPMTCVK